VSASSSAALSEHAVIRHSAAARSDQREDCDVPRLLRVAALAEAIVIATFGDLTSLIA
jgi:hypothetical protein